MQVSQFRDAYGEFRRLNVEVAAVSVDSPYSHRVFARELGVEFPMLSDIEHTMLADYDALGAPRAHLGKFAHYHAFVIDPERTIVYARYQPESGGLSPVDEVLEAVRALPDRQPLPEVE